MQKKSKFLVFLWIIVWLNMIFYWQILLWQFDFWYPYYHRCVSFLEPFSGSCCGWSCGLGTLPEVGGCCKEGFGRFVGEIGCALLQLHRKTSNWHHSNVDSRRSPRRLWRRQIKKRWVWYGNALAPWFLALLLYQGRSISLSLFLIVELAKAMLTSLRLACDTPEERIKPERGPLADVVADFGKMNEDLRWVASFSTRPDYLP